MLLSFLGFNGLLQSFALLSHFLLLLLQFFPLLFVEESFFFRPSLPLNVLDDLVRLEGREGDELELSSFGDGNHDFVLWVLGFSILAGHGFDFLPSESPGLWWQFSAVSFVELELRRRLGTGSSDLVALSIEGRQLWVFLGWRTNICVEFLLGELSDRICILDMSNLRY